ncbi:MAG: restriction endonuclease subunit S [Nitrososphaera sp.]|jgi:type I restriction enzyme S subunit
MSGIKSSAVLLQEIAELKKGTEPGSKNYSKAGKVRFLRISDLTGSREGSIYVPELQNLVMVNENDVLFSLDGTPGVVTRGHVGAISSGIRRVKPLDPKIVSKEYLYYALQSRGVQETVRKYSKGVTIKHASSALRYIKIPLPELDDQRRIIKKLEAIEMVLRSQKKLRTEAATFRESILNIHFNTDTAAKKGWEIKSLEDVCEELYRYPTFYGFKFTKSGVPVLKISNFSEMDMFDSDLSNYDFITNEINAQFPKTILKRDDLVMGVRGTYIGKCVPVPSFLEGANMTPNLIRIAPDREIIRPRFLWHFTCSSWWNEQIDSLVHYWKLKFGTIRADQLKKVKIPIPKFEIQDALLQQMDKSLTIVKELDVIIRDTEELYNSTLDRVIS